MIPIRYRLVTYVLSLSVFVLFVSLSFLLLEFFFGIHFDFVFVMTDDQSKL